MFHPQCLGNGGNNYKAPSTRSLAQAVLSRPASCCQDSSRTEPCPQRTRCSPATTTTTTTTTVSVCVAGGNRPAHWDLSNKANANNYALIFIYVYAVIYVCVNGGGEQLFRSPAHAVDCIIDQI